MKINHALIISSDLEAMKNFWVDIIGLEEGERPPFPFKGYWLYSEGTPFIHLAEQKNAIFDQSAVAHIAFEGADYLDLLARLKQFNYPYTSKVVPLSGEQQVFIQGPDGVTVEMLFPHNKKAEKTSSKETYQAGENYHYLGGKLDE